MRNVKAVEMKLKEKKNVQHVMKVIIYLERKIMNVENVL